MARIGNTSANNVSSGGQVVVKTNDPRLNSARLDAIRNATNPSSAKLAQLNPDGSLTFVDPPSGGATTTLDAWLIRKTSSSQSLIEMSGLGGSFGRNTITFPDVLQMQGVSLSGDTTINISKAGIYDCSASIRIDGMAASVVNIEIVRRRPNNVMRFRGQEFKLSSGTFDTVALSQTSTIDCLSGDTLTLEVTIVGGPGGTVTVVSEHVLCFFSGLIRT